MSTPPSLRVTATYDAPAIPAIGFALPDAEGTLFTQERTERGARLVERDAVTFAERASWDEPDVPLRAWRRILGASPDGALLAVYDFAAGRHGVRFLRRSDGASWVVPVEAPWERLRWSRDGRTALAVGPRAVTWIDVDARAALDRAERRGDEYTAERRDRFVRRTDDARGGRLAVVAREGRKELASWALPPAASVRWCAADDALDALWCAVTCGDRHELRFLSLRANAAPAVSIDEPWLDVVARGDGCAVLTRSGRVARVDSDGDGLSLRWLAPTGVPLAFAPWSVDATSTDGRRAVVSHGRRFAVVDLDTGESRAPASVSAGVDGALATSRDGHRVALRHDDGAVAVLDAATLTPEASFELDPPPRRLAFAPDGRTLHAWGPDAWTSLDLRDGSTHVVAELPTRHGDAGVRYGDGDVSPDGRFGAVAVYRDAEEAAEWLRVDLARGVVTLVEMAYDSSLRGVRFSEDGRFVVGLQGDWRPHRAETIWRVRCDASTGAPVHSQTVLTGVAPPPGGEPSGERSAHLGPRGAFVVVLDALDHARQRLRVERPDGAPSAGVPLRVARVLAVSATRIALVENERTRDMALTVRDAETLDVVVQAPWEADNAPREACFAGDDALLVVCGDRRLVRLAIDAG